MDVELKHQFEEMGIDPSDDVLAKSLDLCVDYNIKDGVEFVEQWIAFSISNLQGAEPTIDHLREFERKVLQSKRDSSAIAKKKSRLTGSGMSHFLDASTSKKTESNPLAIYGVASDPMTGPVAIESTTAEEMDLDSYNVYHTPKAKSALARTPARLAADARFSPASYSPIGTPRSREASVGSGKVIVTFGNPTIINKAQWSAVNYPQIHVKQLLLHNNLPLNKDARYMFDDLPVKCDLMGERIFVIGRALCHKEFGQEAYELQQVNVTSQSAIKTVGVVCCEHGGPLDATSILLLGSDETTCRMVRLNISRCKTVALFPGQVVMVSGINPRGDTLFVDHIMSERELLSHPSPKNADSLSFVVASGPFTHDDDLVYEPLHDFMTFLKTQPPNVLILTGPFLDAKHKLITHESTTLAESFDSFFEKMISGIVDMIGTSTTILVVPSHRDANADAVYPTMPYSVKKTFPNVHFLPDPSMVDVNGIVIGVTSLDVVKQIITNELAINAGDKIKRVINYLLNQGSFYPLQPPEEDEVGLDSLLEHQYAKIDKVPNVLILPSEQKSFIRAVNNCLVINPGRVSEKSGGTFARFFINPPAPKDEGNILNFMGAQVRRV